MRTKIKSIIIFAVLVILAFVALAIISDDTRNYTDIDYSSYSIDEYGAKAFYLSVKEYGKKTKLYKTERYNKYARFLPDNSLTVILEPEMVLIDQFELNALREYIKKGNSFVFLTSADTEVYSNSILQDMILSEENGVKVYRFKSGDGQISFFNSMDVLNNPIKTNNDKAADVLVYIGNVCKEKKYDSVFINEYYHTGEAPISGSDVYGMGLSLLMAQICITLIIWAIYKGVRLGKPEVVAQTIKRNETENIYALANLYKKTKSPRIAFDIHMEGLLQDVAKYMGLNTIDDSNREFIYSEIRSDKKLIDLGVNRLLRLYESDERISNSNIRNVIEKIEKIRKEL